MITNQDIIGVWERLSDNERRIIIKRFNLQGKNPKEFLHEINIKNKITNHFISMNKKVVTK
jgi:hypothetical protein